MTAHVARSERQGFSQTSACGFKSGLLFVGQLFITFVVMVIAFVASTAVIGVRMELSAEETGQSGIALLVVSFINSLVLAYFIARSRWHGIKLIAAIFIVHFGIQTFMSQIETLFFINAIQMPLDMVMRVIATGLLRAAIFAPIAVVAFGKLKETPMPVNDTRWVFSKSEWIKRFAILAAVYVIVYFAFGYFVAFQWVEARQYYAGTLANDLVLPLFQVLRGVMWAALAVPMVKMHKGRTWEICFAVGLGFAVLLATPILFPNQYMPPMVRQAHFFELTSSMLTYGAIAGWVWTWQAKPIK